VYCVRRIPKHITVVKPLHWRYFKISLLLLSLCIIHGAFTNSYKIICLRPAVVHNIIIHFYLTTLSGHCMRYKKYLTVYFL
jgi:hypothetical protein